MALSEPNTKAPTSRLAHGMTPNEHRIQTAEIEEEHSKATFGVGIHHRQKHYPSPNLSSQSSGLPIDILRDKLAGSQLKTTASVTRSRNEHKSTNEVTLWEDKEAAPVVDRYCEPEAATLTTVKAAVQRYKVRMKTTREALLDDEHGGQQILIWSWEQRLGLRLLRVRGIDDEDDELEALRGTRRKRMEQTPDYSAMEVDLPVSWCQ
ncbi:hypothetical protein FB45DRAFT_860116 [Roridomyces roridus]|uniref:Uncharacterized protein n=1 Tax=Roridomyces roridus TaxID=1738132 RepID=A0AAD7CE87_9AGAR|nr:hypothetical protein FB45DRAFT_884114 [Roridomyces roridus]KAJ7646643.1 hypothetical protein FB45DRAFT_860116 [Roridomyces roridus]